MVQITNYLNLCLYKIIIKLITIVAKRLNRKIKGTFSSAESAALNNGSI